MKPIDPEKIWQVGIKGLVFDDGGKLMLVKEEDGMWELPGGRIEHGEDIQETLKREVKEEMGLECEVLDDHPYWAWPERIEEIDWWRVLMCYRMKLDSLDFTPSEECVDLKFFDKQGLIDLGDRLYSKMLVNLI